MCAPAPHIVHAFGDWRRPDGRGAVCRTPLRMIGVRVCRSLATRTCGPVRSPTTERNGDDRNVAHAERADLATSRCGHRCAAARRWCQPARAPPSRDSGPAPGGAPRRLPGCVFTRHVRVPVRRGVSGRSHRRGHRPCRGATVGIPPRSPVRSAGCPGRARPDAPDVATSCSGGPIVSIRARWWSGRTVFASPVHRELGSIAPATSTMRVSSGSRSGCSITTAPSRRCGARSGHSHNAVDPGSPASTV